MNTNYSQSNLIFRDQPLFTVHAPSTRRSSLRAACRESSDRLEVVLRFFLVLCMLTALLICGWHVSAWQNSTATAGQPTVAAGVFGVSGQHVF